MAVCNVCFRHCRLQEGEISFCGGRICRNGEVRAYNYGKITALALDPIEKKPLRRFYPGSSVVSVGSFGCNLRCPFCQNYTISWSEEAKTEAENAEEISPGELAELAARYRKNGNIGLAFTYNEPLIGYEFVRDAAREAHRLGMKNVLVTNGTAGPEVLEQILPHIDAMNIDLKGFTETYYRDVLRGSREMTMNFITEAAKECHVEITTLIVPGENDTEEEMEEISGWIAGLCNGTEIPLHISRFFPRFHMTDRKATDVDLIYRLAGTARKNLKYVYTGNC